MAEPTIIKVQEEDNGQRIERWLKKNAPHIPYALAQKLFRKGAVKIDGKKAKASDAVATGQEIRLPAVEARSERKEKRIFSIEDAEKYILNNVVYEDEKLIVINKPAGLPAQGGSKVKVSVDDLLPFLGKGLKLVHRIDKDTSGIMLIGKGRENTADLSRRFQARTVEKTYWAIVVGVPELREGKINLPLGVARVGEKIEKAVVDEANGKRAVTLYKVMANASDTLSWVEMYPESGRMHQLRVHMNAIGNPIMGDGKYGGKQAFIHGLSNNMHLHARSITLPDYKGKKPLTVTADLPPHMERTFKTFEFE